MDTALNILGTFFQWLGILTAIGFGITGVAILCFGIYTLFGRVREIVSSKI